MNLHIINGCAVTDPGLPTAETDPDRSYDNGLAWHADCTVKTFRSTVPKFN